MNNDHAAMASALLQSAGAIARQAAEYEGGDGQRQYAHTLATMAVAESVLALAYALTYEDASTYPVGGGEIR